MLTLIRAMALAFVVTACGDEKPSLGPADQTYTVKGVVEGFTPAADGQRAHASIRHEAIAAFVSREGRVVGMESMVMPFELADSVQGVTPTAGQKVELVLEVRWSGGPQLLITQMRTLPADTPLELSPSGHGH
jgi:hypothetical protein